MAEPVHAGLGGVPLDTCRTCCLVWLDPEEVAPVDSPPGPPTAGGGRILPDLLSIAFEIALTWALFDD